MVYYYTYSYGRLGWIAVVLVFAIILCIIRARRNAARLAAAQSTVQVVMTPVDSSGGYPQMQEPGLSYYQPPAPAYTPGAAATPYLPPNSTYPPQSQGYPGSPYQAPAQGYPPVDSPYKPPTTYPPMNDQQQQWQQQQLSLQQQQQQQPFQYSPTMTPVQMPYSPSLQVAPSSPGLGSSPGSVSMVSPAPAPNTAVLPSGMFSPPPTYTAAHPSLQPAPPVDKPLEHQAYPMPPMDMNFAGASGSNSAAAAPVSSTQQQQQQQPRPAQAPQGLQ